jgi:hypothetical protein
MSKKSAKADQAKIRVISALHLLQRGLTGSSKISLLFCGVKIDGEKSGRRIE